MNRRKQLLTDEEARSVPDHRQGHFGRESYVIYRVKPPAVFTKSSHDERWWRRSLKGLKRQFPPGTRGRQWLKDAGVSLCPRKKVKVTAIPRKTFTQLIVELAHKYGIEHPMRMTVVDFCDELARKRYAAGAHEHANEIMRKIALSSRPSTPLSATGGTRQS